MQRSCYNLFISSVHPAGFEEVTLPRAVRDIESLPTRIQNRVLARIENMNHNLKGDVKRLTDFTPEYRLRVGTTEFYSKLKAR